MIWNRAPRRPRIRLSLIATVCGLAWSRIAFGQDLSEQRLEENNLAGQSSQDWNITLGAGLGTGPAYPGAERYRVEAIPFASVSYRDWASVGPGGLRIDVIDWNGFRAGPVLGFMGGRDQDRDPHLEGLGDIDNSLTAGLFASYHIGPFQISATGRQALTNTQNGIIGLISLNYRSAIIPGLLDLELGPELTLGSGKYNQTWFGVTSAQSQASGLPVFTSSGGINDIGAHVNLTYHYSEHILIRAFVDLKTLVGTNSDSPIVENSTQAQLGLGLAYHF